MPVQTSFPRANFASRRTSDSHTFVPRGQVPHRWQCAAKCSAARRGRHRLKSLFTSNRRRHRGTSMPRVGFTWLHLSLASPLTSCHYPCLPPANAPVCLPFPFGGRNGRHDLRCWQLFSTYDAHALSARIKSFALQLAPAADACAVTTKREKRREVSALRRRSNGTSAALPRTAAVGHPVRTTIMQCAGPSPLRIWTRPAQHLCARFAGTLRARAR